MKILHTLVGYLAVTALPSHPFAFASPLAAIDYDGYVKNTQNPIDGAVMKHVLDSIVETCRTVTYHSDYVNTTQNHRDSNSALMKRVPGDIIEARQTVPADFLPYAAAIVAILGLVTLSIIWVEGDDPKRTVFTQNSVSQASAKYPNFNWVICHSPYSTAFNGVEGTDWGYNHHELKISFGRTIGYDIYWARSGTFNRYGDGGYINWAYVGNVVGIDGGSVTFGVI